MRVEAERLVAPHAVGEGDVARAVGRHPAVADSRTGWSAARALPARPCGRKLVRRIGPELRVERLELVGLGDDQQPLAARRAAFSQMPASTCSSGDDGQMIEVDEHALLSA